MTQLFRLLCLLLALAFSPAHAEPPALPLPWVQASQFFFTPSQVRLYTFNAAYAQTHRGNSDGAGNWQPDCEGHCSEGQWLRADLKPWGVTADAKAAFLSGLLVITHGAAQETADLHITFRRPGDTSASCDKYIGQAIEASALNGQRSGIATWVPLENGAFEWCYRTYTTGQWPANSAYAVNLSLQAWAR